MRASSLLMRRMEGAVLRVADKSRFIQLYDCNVVTIIIITGCWFKTAVCGSPSP
jgi:hypothetical protein